MSMPRLANASPRPGTGSPPGSLPNENTSNGIVPPSCSPSSALKSRNPVRPNHELTSVPGVVPGLRVDMVALVISSLDTTESLK